MAAMQLLAAAVLAASTSFVQADVLWVRSEGKPTAAPVGRLRINTQVSVARTAKGWALLQSPLKGWVSESMLGPKQADAAELRARLASAPAAQRLGLVERLVALEPHDAELQRQLAKLLTEAGRAEAAALVQQRLAGKLPEYVGLCTKVAGRLQVVLVATTAGVLLAGATDEDLAALASRLGGLSWLALPGGTRLDGTPFPSPSIEYGVLDSEYVRLGACSAPGTLYVSGPMVPAAGGVKSAFGGEAITVKSIANGVSIAGVDLALVEPPQASNAPLYLAATTGRVRHLLARVTRDGSLQPLAPTFASNDYECPATNVDVSAMAEDRREQFEAFEADSRALEQLLEQELRWFAVDGRRPRRRNLAGTVACESFPELVRHITFGETGSTSAEVYATWPLTRSGNAWQTAAGLRIELTPFDQVSCEARGDDQICGGDRGWDIATTRRDGKRQTLHVVTQRVGC